MQIDVAGSLHGSNDLFIVFGGRFGIALEIGADLLEPVTQLGIVEALAGFRIDIEQWHNDRSRRFIVGYQIANDSRSENILPQLGQ